MHSHIIDGLRNKYLIKKTDGTPVDPEARYFLLRYDTDPHAKKVLAAYADSVESENPQLADDLRDALTN